MEFLSLYFISVYALQEETTRIALELDGLRDKTKENQEKIKLNKQLPYLVGNVVEVSRIWFSLFHCVAIVIFCGLITPLLICVYIIAEISPVNSYLLDLRY